MGLGKGGKRGKLGIWAIGGVGIVAAAGGGRWMSMSPRRAERSVQRRAGAGASFRASLVVIELVIRVCMRERC